MVLVVLEKGWSLFSLLKKEKREGGGRGGGDPCGLKKGVVFVLKKGWSFLKKWDGPCGLKKKRFLWS